MPKFFFAFLMNLASMATLAQRSVDSLLGTEMAFAAASVQSNTKEAFLKFVDTAGIVFDRGKAVNGLTFYRNSEKTSGVLSWEPEYVEISSTRDFGYTTGPWTYFANSMNEKPVMQGHFVTVWHLTGDGKWKFLVDLGISYGKKNQPAGLTKILDKKTHSEDSDDSSLLNTEKKFIDDFSRHGIRAYNHFLSLKSRLNYKGFLPATRQSERTELLDSVPVNIRYKVLGYGLSPAKDLGFVYGQTTINENRDGYLRVWRREKQGWKIAVEVLHFK